MQLNQATRDALTSLDRQCERIEQAATRDNGGTFTADQREEWHACHAQIRGLMSMPTNSISTAGRRSMPSSGGPLNLANVDTLHEFDDAERPATRWQNLSTGEPVNVYGPKDRMARGASNASLGRFVRAVITNNWKHATAEREIYNLSEGGLGGHVLVPDELSSQWLDLARAQSRLVQAGMSTVEMNSETMTIARLDDDPSFSVTAENETIDDSDVTFGAVQLVSRKIATIITMSREIAEDAPNAPEIVQQVLGRALGVEIDRLCLIGNGGSDGVQGIVTGPRTGMGSTGTVGAIAWEDFHTAVVGVRENNYTPNAVVVHPTILGDAQILTSGDGTNSAKLWLGPPPSLDGVEFLTTTGITTAYAVAGEFQHCLMGVRTGMLLEVSNTADDAFEKHQVKIKVTQRFSFVVPQPAAFHVLSGITT